MRNAPQDPAYNNDQPEPSGELASWQVGDRLASFGVFLPAVPPGSVVLAVSHNIATALRCRFPDAILLEATTAATSPRRVIRWNGARPPLRWRGCARWPLPPAASSWQAPIWPSQPSLLDSAFRAGKVACSSPDLRRAPSRTSSNPSAVNGCPRRGPFSTTNTRSVAAAGGRSSCRYRPRASKNRFATGTTRCFRRLRLDGELTHRPPFLPVVGDVTGRDPDDLLWTR